MTDYYPSFFLVLEFDAKDSCQRAYLIHIDKEYIRRVLHRLREIEVSLHDGQPLELHRKTLQFTYSPADALSSLDGKGLEQAIRRHVPESPEEYATKKVVWCQTVGYEEGTRRLTFKVEPVEGYESIREYLVDFSLGLIPHMNASYGELTDIRFGIASPRSRAVFDQGLTIVVERASAGEGVLVFSTADGLKELRISTETFVPHGFAITDVNDEYFKIRFATPFINFIVQRQGLRARFDFTFPSAKAEYLLKDIQPICMLTQFLHDAETRNTTVRVEAFFKSQSLVTITMQPNFSFTPDSIKFATCITSAWNIAKHFDIFQDMVVKPADLYRQYGEIFLLHSLLNKEHFWMRLIFSARSRLAQEKKELCAPYAVSAIVGKYYIAAAIALIGKPIQTEIVVRRGKQFEMQTDNVKLCRTFVYDSAEAARYTEDKLKGFVIQAYEESKEYVLLV